MEHCPEHSAHDRAIRDHDKQFEEADRQFAETSEQLGTINETLAALREIEHQNQQRIDAMGGASTRWRTSRRRGGRRPPITCLWLCWGLSSA